MRRSFNCPACIQLVTVDFDAESMGVMPPHGSKRADGSRSCGQIGQPVRYEDPEVARRRRQAEAAELTRQRDEELRELARLRELERAVEEARRARGLPPLRGPSGGRPEASLLAVLALMGAGAGVPRVEAGRGRPRFPRPRRGPY